jgi:hypothetical protein
MLDTPKKYFNVKAQQSGQRMKMAVMEHHSAGYRNNHDDSPIKLRDGQATLSQISSVLSEKESPLKKGGTTSIPSCGENSAKNSHFRSGFV